MPGGGTAGGAAAGALMGGVAAGLGAGGVYILGAMMPEENPFPGWFAPPPPNTGGNIPFPESSGTWHYNPILGGWVPVSGGVDQFPQPAPPSNVLVPPSSGPGIGER